MGGKAMKRVFTIGKPFRVPDGTLVSPFLNPKDSMSGLPFDLLKGFSLAAGTIEPKTKSKIHVMPFVTQVTFVRQGELTVRMKGHPDRTHYALTVLSNQARFRSMATGPTLFVVPTLDSPTATRPPATISAPTATGLRMTVGPRSLGRR